MISKQTGLDTDGRALSSAVQSRPIFILAHELRQAIEVLEAPDVYTENAVDQLIERIGTHVYSGAVETEAALDAERAVRRELSRRD
jgi:hypothetical protein